MKKQILYSKAGVWIFALFPIIRLIWLGINDGLGANPVEFVERSTGTWTLVFLLLTLTATPFRLVTGEVWLIRLRRLLGLWMFFYACLHIAAYVWLDYGFYWPDIVNDIVKHPFVIVGFGAFMLTIPLAATSNQVMMKRLKSNWKKLHQLIYLIAILAILHFWWLVKKDVTEPLYYSLALACLFAIRLYFKYNRPIGRNKIASNNMLM
ncbi:MAG TPA: protein-methionine-sulfoxide reductase heme-binding subunit MsrQ [Methylophilus sp.]|nr:protein-methionine-sulfoxide reductase heme-binding subunit MsrQ [Methylophilus sp.]HQQ34049.1 protein-methionine-sulfoxide reductase heme-binding subunit MsrQ [Methylophilus sp.]